MSGSLPSRHIRWSGATDRGRVRPHNEDCFLGLQFDGREVHRLGKIGEAKTGDHHFAFAVSDGMGGAHAGEFASRVTVDKITHLMPRSFRQDVTGIEAGFIDVLEELFAQIDKALKYLGGSYPEECLGMGATLTLCWLTAEWLHFGHVGDSRIYYLEGATGKTKQISHDDTYVGWLRRNGKISESEARRHPGRVALQKALGSDYQFINPQVGSVYLQPGDKFLLCTDGLCEGLFDSQIGDKLAEPRPITDGDPLAQRFLASSLASGGGGDNLTALVIEVAHGEADAAP